MKASLLVVALSCIFGAAWGISDKAILEQIRVLTKKVAELDAENKQFQEIVKSYETRISQLEKKYKHKGFVQKEKEHALVQNTTIEERVPILETQMTEVQDEVAELEVDMVNVGEDVDVINDQQVVQDQRIFALEQETSDFDERVETVEETSDSLSNRITAAEDQIEDLNSSTSDLDGRVETLEGETSELDTRLTAVETEIEGLQETDVDLNARISDLELAGTTIAFRAVMNQGDADNIPVGSTVTFSTVSVNIGGGYSSGIFTAPSEGYYYFATHFTVENYKYATIDLVMNSDILCSMADDNQEVHDDSNGGCNAVVHLSEGDQVKNVYRTGTDAYPFFEEEDGDYNGFSGFKI